MTELAKQYEPKLAQQKWFSWWQGRGYFDANPTSQQKGAKKPPHTIMIPLPNVTGALHMGHALNGTLQDLITRYKRMQGFEALWMPGTDHAGIATQAVVERRMFEEEGLTRRDIGREALVERIWKWKDIYEQRILGQQKQLGASCDWRRTRFTLDDVCSRAVRRTFFKMFKDGLVFRGKRLVNWDTHLQTAVADDEVFEEEVDGNFWTFHYPVVDDAGKPTGEKISFSTTRPETMLGDSAVCVHPSDERYKNIVGKRVLLPLSNRTIPIIADALLAKMDMGTGAVKVTPAHDPNDYAAGLRNNLEMINVMNPDGTMNAECGPYAGLDRFEARKKVVEDMTKLGYFEKVEARVIPLKHSDRSKTPVEPYLSNQWFIKMDTLAQAAMDAVEDGRVKFFPPRYSRTYLDWLGEKRDWCISRQLWWGHRIPIWRKTIDANDQPLESLAIKIDTATKSAPIPDDLLKEISVTFGEDLEDGRYTLLVCVDTGHPQMEQLLEGLGFAQEDDVLDTWFSSALWPHATLGWPDEKHNPPLNNQPDPNQPGKNEVLDYFYPGNVLVTSRDIITLWVARMVLTGLYNMGDVPFKHVCIHPKILDGFGQTMSKSKGNGVDPMDLIDKYGTDAVRFTISSFAGETQDVRLPVGYECPHCGTVIPQEKEHQKLAPRGGAKPTIQCTNPKCKKKVQFTSPWFEPDEGEPVARIVSERFEYGRNFCNKLWNATRFAMMNLEGYTPAPLPPISELPLEDKWMLSRLSSVVEEVTTSLERYQFDVATRSIRDFAWNEFCDWYLEMIKPRLRDEALKPVAQRVLVGCLDTMLRLLAPFTPFIVEELWQRLAEIAPERGLIDVKIPEASSMIAAWPTLPTSWKDPQVEARFARLQETIIAVRNVRALYKIPPSASVKLMIRATPEVAGQLGDVASQFENLSKAVLTAAGADVVRPPASASFTLGEAEGYLPLEGLIDVEAELARQRKESEKLAGFIKSHEAKLANEGFTSKAPPHVLDAHRETLAGWKTQLESIEQIITQLSGK